ncbi:hypothetical protein [Longimicrobium sp.]|uniref:hypothetical protein n=1 Tax=Longimicrobium sp. TaxID=2029185 RepID=UPI002B84D324|nr:hypothetical protein [Longimicrobium sp.]HSU13271.1 hypothetical protein [Longimicrobium sp.]
MTGSESFDCSNCGHRVTGEAADHIGWCKACRKALVRRSGWLAMFPAFVVLALYLWMLDYFELWNSTFLIVFMALGLALAYVAFKVARRVFFDVIRARGVKPPAS